MRSRDSFVWNVKKKHRTILTCSVLEQRVLPRSLFCSISQRLRQILSVYYNSTGISSKNPGALWRCLWLWQWYRTQLHPVNVFLKKTEGLKGKLVLFPNTNPSYLCSLFPRSQTFGSWLLPSARPELAVSVKIVQFQINMSVFMLRKKLHKVNLY